MNCHPGEEIPDAAIEKKKKKKSSIIKANGVKGENIPR